MKIDTDKLVEILKKDKPLSVMAVEEEGYDKLLCLFVLPSLSTKVIDFAQQLLNEIDKNEQADKVVLAVMSDLNRRSEVGIKKYKTTLDRTDLELRDWLQHVYEECLDQANYLKRAIMELEEKEGSK